MMAHILDDAATLSSLRDEINPVVAEGIQGLEYRLEQRCPRLVAIANETLRLTASSSTIRGVQRTTYLDGKLLRAGAQILIPYRLAHFDSEVFGKNPEVFQAERFLEAKNLGKSPTFRPFGGGKSYCPGRFFARREVYTFVALALHRFDITINAVKRGGFPARASTSVVPRMDLKKFSLAVVDPVKGDDLIIDLQKRERSELPT